MSAPALAIAQDRSVRDVVDQIVRDGPQARAIREEVEVRRREHLVRLAYPNPAVQYTREGAGFTEFLQVEQSLPLFGVRSLLTGAGVEATAAAEADRDARLWVLRADAQTAVARLITEQNRHLAAEQYVKDVERLIELLRTREREGEGSKFDRLRAEHELQEARQIVTAEAIAVSDARSRVLAMSPPNTSLSRVTLEPAATRRAFKWRRLSNRPGHPELNCRRLNARGPRRILKGRLLVRLGFHHPPSSAV